MTTIASTDNSAKLKSLKNKHAAIEEKLSEALKAPSTADFYLKQLKRQKLVLKDTIEHLRKRSANS